MQNRDQIWSLELAGEVIATLVFTEHEFPWTYARLRESPKFERFREYFGNEDDWPETPEFEALCEEIYNKGKFSLRNLTSGETHHLFRLNQDGEVVWFRF
jgi:hypothetical protein